jgi:hypothetical protein
MCNICRICSCTCTCRLHLHNVPHTNYSFGIHSDSSLFAQLLWKMDKLVVFWLSYVGWDAHAFLADANRYLIGLLFATVCKSWFLELRKLTLGFRFSAVGVWSLLWPFRTLYCRHCICHSHGRFHEFALLFQTSQLAAKAGQKGVSSSVGCPNLPVLCLARIQRWVQCVLSPNLLARRFFRMAIRAAILCKLLSELCVPNVPPDSPLHSLRQNPTSSILTPQEVPTSLYPNCPRGWCSVG